MGNHMSSDAGQNATNICLAFACSSVPMLETSCRCQACNEMSYGFSDNFVSKPESSSSGFVVAMAVSEQAVAERARTGDLPAIRAAFTAPQVEEQAKSYLSDLPPPQLRSILGMANPTQASSSSRCLFPSQPNNVLGLAGLSQIESQWTSNRHITHNASPDSAGSRLRAMHSLASYCLTARRHISPVVTRTRCYGAFRFR